TSTKMDGWMDEVDMKWDLNDVQSCRDPLLIYPFSQQLKAHSPLCPTQVLPLIPILGMMFSISPT
uniref:Uncharacterized protein n=1 Tax=Mola mola TaxID=94237 RepID=A0A3Q3VY19_MOLML